MISCGKGKGNWIKRVDSGDPRDERERSKKGDNGRSRMKRGGCVCVRERERERKRGRAKRKSQRVNELGREAENGIVKRRRIERERVSEKKKVIRKE